MSADLLAPCGLYCGTCLENVVGEGCHGCGCACGTCAGEAHARDCDIAQCAHSQGYDTCAECDDMPCVRLILFAYHPLAIHHLQAIEVLRRVRRVGRERVLRELGDHFADEETRSQWAFIEEYGWRRHSEYERWRAGLRSRPETAD